MLKSYKLHEMSEFERELFRQKLESELETLNEIQQVLIESPLFGTQKRQSLQAKKIKKEIEYKMEQVKFEKQLKMITLSLPEMRQLEKKLKKRLVKKLDSKQIQEKLSFLRGRLEEEILQEEFGLKPGFKSFPLTDQEFEVLSMA